jgi:hypothetical protein
MECLTARVFIWLNASPTVKGKVRFFIKFSFFEFIPLQRKKMRSVSEKVEICSDPGTTDYPDVADKTLNRRKRRQRRIAHETRELARNKED